MNIAFVISTKNWGGVKTWMLEFGCGLRELGHTVHFFASDKRLIEQARLRGCEAHHVHFGFDYNPAAILRFRRIFKRYKIDATIMNIYKELRSAGVAAKSLGIPVVHRVGLTGDIEPGPKTAFVHKRIVSRILVPCRIMKEELIESVPFLEDKDIRYIYNGREPKTDRTRSSGSPVRFVISSKLAKSKGHEMLFKALSMAWNYTQIPFKVDVYGEGKERENLEKLAYEYKINDKIEFLGFDRGVADKLSTYDFGLLSSRTEGLPNVILEYMASGLPVVSTDVCCIPELVQDGVNGYLCSKGDVDGMAECIKKCLLMDATEYAEMSAASLEMIKGDFNFTKRVQELASWLEELR
ncbi:glycosyltransferase [Limisalsivibrio acetivorans]|uniref:glycosyltransferase n=1 Tax=Limisalsivibrio acetivorans TaxID=1304888 RepID=UPI0003B5AFE7|nr:glycosyltransferase [Limisalsivibrio acetivorans]